MAVICYTPEEFNEKLAMCEGAKIMVHMKGEKYAWQPFKTLNTICSAMANVWEKETYVYLLYKKHPNAKTIEYRFYLSGEPREEDLYTVQAAQMLVRYTKPYNIPNVYEWFGKNTCKVGTLSYYNEKFSGKRQWAISYDMNSAYSWGMLQPMPETSCKPKLNDVVGEGELGYKIEDGYLRRVKKGDYAYWIFPEMPSPFKKFVEKIYEKKKSATNPRERKKYKSYLNVAIGQLHGAPISEASGGVKAHWNPFLACEIIGRCREFMESLIDENTILCNTDCICSAVRRPDIEKMIGNEIGQFKVEHEGLFASKSEGRYQWGFDVPSIKGVPKQRKGFKDGKYDLLRDPLPPSIYPYVFDWDNIRVKENSEYWE